MLRKIPWPWRTNPNGLAAAESRLHPGRHYGHEVFLLAWSIFIGLGYVIGVPPAGSLAARVSPPVIISWAWVMIIGGVVGLLGCYWPRSRFDLALLLERAGLLLQSGALVLFTTAVMANAGLPGLTVAGICLAWVVANLSRVWRITASLHYAATVAGDREPDVPR